MGVTFTASEFICGKCEAGIPILSKKRGPIFRTEFPTKKAGEVFISTYVCKLLRSAHKFDWHQFFRSVFVGKIKSLSAFSCIWK